MHDNLYTAWMKLLRGAAQPYRCGMVVRAPVMGAVCKGVPAQSLSVIRTARQSRRMGNCLIGTFCELKVPHGGLQVPKPHGDVHTMGICKRNLG